jgi:outer membrane protein TolC
LGYEKAESMEEFMLGVRQEIPRSSRLRLKEDQFGVLASAQKRQAEVWDRQLTRNVRMAYLDLWYQQQALKIVRHHLSLLSELTGAAAQQYAVGRLSQQQLIMLELEEDNQKDRLARNLGDEEASRARLARWIGSIPKTLQLDEKNPPLPSLPSLEALKAGLVEHPLLAVDQAGIQAGEMEVALAEQYYTGFMVDGLYTRTDENQQKFNLMLSIEIPLAPSGRQQRNAAAARHQVRATGYDRLERLRQMEGEVEAGYARWERLGQRMDLYQARILPQSHMASDLAASGYQHRVGEYAGWLRASVAAFENELSYLRLLTEQASVQAELLYYTEK